MMTCGGEGYLGPQERDENNWIYLILIAVVAFILGTGLFCLAKHIRDKNERIDEENAKARQEMTKVGKKWNIWIEISFVNYNFRRYIIFKYVTE